MRSKATRWGGIKGHGRSFNEQSSQFSAQFCKAVHRLRLLPGSLAVFSARPRWLPLPSCVGDAPTGQPDSFCPFRIRFTADWSDATRRCKSLTSSRRWLISVERGPIIMWVAADASNWTIFVVFSNFNSPRCICFQKDYDPDPVQSCQSSRLHQI